MKKSHVIAIVIAVLVIAGVGGYLVGQSGNASGSNSSDNGPTASGSGSSLAGDKSLEYTAIISALRAKYPTIKQTYVYSESRDPNDNLGKAGYYFAGAEFYDTRTNTPPDGYAFGADSGGAIEEYHSYNDAAKRVAYLKQFQGDSMLDPGGFQQVANVVVRVSSNYTASQQQDMLKTLGNLVK